MSFRKLFRDFIRLGNPASFNNSDDISLEIELTKNALSSDQASKHAIACKNLDVKRSAEMAYFSSLTYKVEEENLSEMKQMFQKGDAPLTKKYELLGLISNPRFALKYGNAIRPRALVVESSDEVIIAIRGSSDLFDWLGVNAKIASLESIFVQPAYFDLGEWVWRSSLQLFSQDQFMKKKKVIITGHSLGGAVALATGWIFGANFYGNNVQIPVQVYTFGAPPLRGRQDVEIEAGKLLKKANFQEYRFIKAGDIVPILGLFENTTPAYLIGADDTIYYHDWSRIAKLIHLLELAIIQQNDHHPKLLCIRMAKIREALLNNAKLDDDAMLNLETQMKQVGQIEAVAREHDINKYLNALLKS